jgi:hypothetical protein
MQDEPRSIYYAHPMSWYGTDHEKADMQCIRTEWPGIKIVNPGGETITDQFRAWTAAHPYIGPMAFFEDVVKNTEALVYRTFRDGKIGAGVAKEILAAHVWGLPIYRLYSGCTAMVCSAPKIIQGSEADLLWGTLTIAETSRRIKHKVL